MKQNIINKLLAGILPVLCLLFSGRLMAQAPGSETVYGKPFLTLNIDGGKHADVAETIYIGPGTYEINGIWEIYAKNIIIDPVAVITGSGTINIYSPADAGGVASATFIDGNNPVNSIGVPVALYNANGMKLMNIDFPADLVSAGFTNAPSVSTVYIGNDLSLEVNGADVWLGLTVVGDLRFDQDATISGYSADRMVISNNAVLSHMVKDAGATDFFFPIGIADGDYTPASLTGSNEYHVSVMDYTSGPAINVPAEGMDRTWHIYGGLAASVTLYHNTGTDGASYTDNLGFISRYQGGGLWSSAASTDYAGTAGEHTNSGNIPSGIPAAAGDDAAFLTKSSDQASPLPVRLSYFDVYKRDAAARLEWGTMSEWNSKGFAVERSPDGNSWMPVAFVPSQASGGYSNTSLEYHFTDEHPMNGRNFYRLRQEDLDGKYSYSNVRHLWFDLKNTFTLYPNPAQDMIHISGLSGAQLISIYDASGRLLKQQKSQAAEADITIDELSTGVYMLHVTGTDMGEAVFKFMKNK